MITNNINEMLLDKNIVQSNIDEILSPLFVRIVALTVLAIAITVTRKNRKWDVVSTNLLNLKIENIRWAIKVRDETITQIEKVRFLSMINLFQ